MFHFSILPNGLVFHNSDVERETDETEESTGAKNVGFCAGCAVHLNLLQHNSLTGQSLQVHAQEHYLPCG